MLVTSICPFLMSVHSFIFIKLFWETGLLLLYTHSLPHNLHMFRNKLHMRTHTHSKCGALFVTSFIVRLLVGCSLLRAPDGKKTPAVLYRGPETYLAAVNMFSGH